MLRFCFIFALLFAPCEETDRRICGDQMTFSPALPIQFWFIECDTFSEKRIDGVHSKCWCQPFNYDDEIRIQFQDDTGGEFDLVIQDKNETTISTIAFNEISEGIYEAVVIPDDEGVTNDDIQFLIQDTDTTYAKSDCVSIRTAHRETNLISYSNHRNFAGLNYVGESPDPTYYIRVPSRFFHERYPEEDETIELSSSIVATSAQQKTQRLFEVIHAPYYFHQKVKLVLKHQSVTIDDLQWEKEESYDIETGNKRWPLKPATCWLTQKNSIVRNVL